MSTTARLTGRTRRIGPGLALVGPALILAAGRVSAAATTKRVAVRSNGSECDGGSRDPAISADGRYVAFSSFATNLVSGDTNATLDVFVHDRVTGRTRRVSVRSNGNQGNGGSYAPAISADGRYVAFESEATNLVPSDANAQNDIFLRGPLR